MLSTAITSALESEISRVYAQIETELVTRIARELAKGAGASASPVLWRTEKLLQMGRVQGQLADILRRESRNIAPELEDAIVRAMLGAGEADDAILKQVAAVKEQIAAGTWVPAKESAVYQSLAEAAIRNARTALNLTNTSALQAGTQAFQSAVNGAYLKTLTGSTSLDQAVKQAVRELGVAGCVSRT
jgi:DNA-binding Lrp family transcriptional regulator